MQSSNDFFPCFQGRTWRPDAEVRNDLESNLVVLRRDHPILGGVQRNKVSCAHGTVGAPR